MNCVRGTNPNKLSLPPTDCLNDSDSEYDDNSKFNSQLKNCSLVHKRSYRSESELANKNQLQLASGQNIPVISYNENENLTTRKNLPKTQQLQEKVSPQPYGSSYQKLSKTHKSVSSLLTTASQNSAHELHQTNQMNKLLEINQPYLRNQDGSILNLAINERSKKW